MNMIMRDATSKLYRFGNNFTFFTQPNDLKWMKREIKVADGDKFEKDVDRATRGTGLYWSCIQKVIKDHNGTYAEFVKTYKIGTEAPTGWRRV